MWTCLLPHVMEYSSSGSELVDAGGRAFKAPAISCIVKTCHTPAVLALSFSDRRAINDTLTMWDSNDNSEETCEAQDCRKCVVRRHCL